MRPRQLHDIVTPDWVRLWVSFQGNDLDLEQIGVWDEEGDADYPEWLKYDLNEMGLWEMLGYPSDVEQRMLWLLGNGVAPGQPALVQVDRSHWSKSYYGEVDVEYYANIIQVAEFSIEKTARAFEKILASWRKTGLEHDIRDARAALKLRQSNLRFDSFRSWPMDGPLLTLADAQRDRLRRQEASLLGPQRSSALPDRTGERERNPVSSGASEDQDAPPGSRRKKVQRSV